ncbi:MAG TPA: UDP-N-acetylmuramate dehydrogenase, partial [Rhodanobacteraceae bacterium]|nr:UDP-N-acetylmuramate dehydrogenase [Rhodanobacteraceae bacterium]
MPVEAEGYTLQEDASLASRNTLRVASRARRLAEVHVATALPDLLDLPAVRDGRALILGGGSNVLFTGDFDGTVVAMATRGVELLGEDSGATHIRVAAGERWDDFVRWSLGHGYPGLENLIMIPGSVGGAPIQNIGAYGVEVAGFISSVQAFDRERAGFVELAAGECAFAYRDSLFKHAPGRYVVTAVTFALPRQPAVHADYTGLGEELAAMGVGDAAPFHVAEAVVHLRTRKLPDPAVIGNAGSFFKNPRVSAATAAALKREHPAMAQWPAADGRLKLSAAWLIEACGFKGLREGDAGISNRH